MAGRASLVRGPLLGKMPKTHPQVIEFQVLIFGSRSFWAKCPKTPSSRVERRMDPKGAPVARRPEGPPHHRPVSGSTTDARIWSTGKRLASSRIPASHAIRRLSLRRTGATLGSLLRRWVHDSEVMRILALGRAGFPGPRPAFGQNAPNALASD